jgi:inner membrane protein
MVNTLSHLGVGILIGLALGLKGNKFKIVVLLSALPDIDFIPYSIFISASNSLSHETRNQLYYLFWHREFTHSLLFVFLVTLLIWLATKDWLFTVAGFESISSHVYLDYLTTWKMHPLYPFSTNSSIIGAVYFFDPLLNLLPLIPFFIVIMGYLKNKNKLDGQLNGFLASILRKDDKLYASLIFILLIWMMITPVSKAFLVKQISEDEATEISYQNTYPESLDDFITAYSFNSTHFKVLEISYLTGIKKSEYVERISVEGNIPDASIYIERARRLYQNGVIQEIDYPVYSVSEKNGYVTVTLSDARNLYFEDWAYFKSFYKFVFDTQDENYKVNASVQGDPEEELNRNWFS